MADKEEIRARNDIADVIGATVSLRKRGRNYLGLCPFHHEKTPSFNVDPVTQTFKCFGCGVGGDVFKFVEMSEAMSFPEAAEFLARRVGITFERHGATQPVGEREALHDANATAMAYFREMLPKSPVAMEYIQRRGVSQETIDQFLIGYAPEGWNGLIAHLRGKKVDLHIANTAGLIVSKPGGDYYDMFRHRIMFPIHDEQMRIVGFGGRAFGDQQPKYLNTGETPVFAKSKLLYGLPFARRRIQSEERTLLMEGYMDVVAAHQAGHTNAVATLGTSLTDEHARKLARIAPTVVLVYDGDAAGIKATMRASEILEKAEVQVRVTRLPAGEDPDSLLRSDHPERFADAINSAVNRVEALAEYAYSRHDITTEDGRLAFLRDLYRILRDVVDPALCDATLVRYAAVHPMASLGQPAAVAQMRRDLENRRTGPGTPRPRPIQTEYDPTAALSDHDHRVRVLGDIVGSVPPRTDPAGLGPRTREAVQRYRRVRNTMPRELVPIRTEGVPKNAGERAEGEIVRALLDPAARGLVLRAATDDDFDEGRVTPFLRELFLYIRSHEGLVDVDEVGLLAQVDSDAPPEFCTQVREHLQESRAQVTNGPLESETIEGLLATMRKEYAKRVHQEQLDSLRGKSVLSDEDRTQVLLLQESLRKLKGSG